MRRSRLCIIGISILAGAFATMVAASASASPLDDGAARCAAASSLVDSHPCSADPAVAASDAAARTTQPDPTYVPPAPTPNRFVSSAPPPPPPPPPDADVVAEPELPFLAVALPVTVAVPAALEGATTTVPREQPAAAEPVAEPAADDGTNLLSGGLPTIADFVHHPELLLFGAASTAALMLLVIFPVELLNATMFVAYDRMFGWIGGLVPAPLQGLGARMSMHPLIGGVGITAVAALAFSFNDPEFGTSLASLRLFLALLLALFVVGYLATGLTALILKESWHTMPKITLRPFTLVLGVIGVAISRVLDFSPGFMIGLVFGISLAGSGRVRSNAVLLRAGIVLAFGVAAWFGYNAVHEGILSAAGVGHGGESVAGHEGAAEIDGGAEAALAGAGFGPLMSLEMFAAITTEGITALVVALLPFRFLEGSEVFHTSRRVWTASYAVVLLVFFLLVVSSEHNWRAIRQSLWAWLGILVIFAVVCLTTYLFMRHRLVTAVSEESEELVE